MSKQWAYTRGTRFVDSLGRQLILRGVNLGGDSKVPYPYGGTERPTDFADHRTVSFVGRPFPLEEADVHLGRLRRWGFNTLRLIVTWEAVAHEGPGCYDFSYIEYIGRICERAEAHGQFVFIDFHQDAWSRMSGGSGAPGWVFDALGMDFTRFDAADAAHVMQYRYDYGSDRPLQEERYAPMSWPVNYGMAVNGIVWSVFWLGARLTPQWRIGGENVQDFLQRQFLGAVRALAVRLRALPNVIGFDTLNEPGGGWIGQRLEEPPPGEVSPLRAGLRWTPLDGLKVARGLSTTVTRLLTDEKRAQINGSEPVTVNPCGVSIWKAGAADPFEQAGAWRVEGGRAVVCDNDFFRRQHGQTFDLERDGMGPFFRAVAATIRAVRPDWLLFAEINPHATAHGRGFPEGMPASTVNASHWYDIRLLWSKSFDPPMTPEQRAELARRYRAQLGYMKGLGDRIDGGVPTLIGEFGVPYDLNGANSFRRWMHGERDGSIWEAQSTALGLMYDALDALHLSSAQWNYTASNRNDLRIGDRWNQEDLSIFSEDQRTHDADPYSGARAALGFCRPYAQAVQGTLVSVCYESDAQCFRLEYDAAPSIAAPTEIYVPPHFGDDIGVEIDGSVEQRHFDAAARCLKIYAAAPGRVAVTLRPGSPAPRG